MTQSPLISELFFPLNLQNGQVKGGEGAGGNDNIALARRPFSLRLKEGDNVVKKYMLCDFIKSKKKIQK